MRNNARIAPKKMLPALRRELLMAARQWRKLASVAEKRGLEKQPSEGSQ
jgi:hypothetical protein